MGGREAVKVGMGAIREKCRGMTLLLNNSEHTPAWASVVSIYAFVMFCATYSRMPQERDEGNKHRTSWCIISKCQCARFRTRPEYGARPGKDRDGGGKLV